MCMSKACISITDSLIVEIPWKMLRPGHAQLNFYHIFHLWSLVFRGMIPGGRGKGCPGILDEEGMWGWLHSGTVEQEMDPLSKHSLEVLRSRALTFSWPRHCCVYLIPWAQSWVFRENLLVGSLFGCYAWKAGVLPGAVPTSPSNGVGSPVRKPCPIWAARPSAAMHSVLCTKNLLIDMIGRVENGASVWPWGWGDGRMGAGICLIHWTRYSESFIPPSTYFPPLLGLNLVSLLKKWTGSLVLCV